MKITINNQGGTILHRCQTVNLTIKSGNKTCIDTEIPTHTECRVNLPDMLATPEAQILLNKLQQAAVLDANFQPTEKVSKIYAALIADEFRRRLSLDKCWSIFEQLWGRKNMRNDYQRAIESAKSLTYIEEIQSYLT